MPMRTLLLLSLMVFGVTPSRRRRHGLHPSRSGNPRPANAAAPGSKHLKANGFAVTVNAADTSALATLKRQAGIGDKLASCHTAKIDGYVIEGHVPSSDIERSLPSGPTRSASPFPACRWARQAWSRAPRSSLTTCC